MMQPAGGMIPPPMAPPQMDLQHQHAPPPQQQWMMMPPPPQQTQPLPQVGWGQQPPPPQQQMMAPPPPLQQQQYPPVAVPPPPQPQTQATGGTTEIRTLWIGDLQYWMEESYLQQCFAHTGEIVSAKVIRNKQTGQSEGYGFIEFASRAAAERILQTYNGTMMPNTEQPFRLNWASFGVGEKRPDDGTDYPIFVGDLASDVTDYMLQETFRSRFPSVRGAKVVTDRITGRSKGYGFVRFGDANEQTRAITEMNGVFCSTRPMRIGPATTKKNVGAQQYTSKVLIP
ncbi:Polyadenylate-binding protein RBP45 [Acorus gramineus]|uniref:Polyadenylate-binding protein RBP45 n=1 Tax=Acorus gramineus TaxID=55184 RepID=A0AAV9BYB3_ACOGR|nr:Polyadenylate-binding protein RBP45 [Acorus gramineus]